MKKKFSLNNALNKLKELEGVKTDGELEDLLGLKRRSLGYWRRDKKDLPLIFINYCIEKNYSLDEILEIKSECCVEDPQIQEYLKIYRRYQNLQRSADRKIIDFCILNIQNSLSLFEQEIQKRKEFEVIKSDRSQDHEVS